MSSDGGHPVSALVTRWTAAWNACDPDSLADLAHPDFRADRPNGDAMDLDGFRELVARQSYGVALKLYPQRLYGRGDGYALGGRGEYRYVESGELAEASDDIGLALELRDGLVVAIAPQPSQAAALERAGLTEDDLIEELGG